MKFLLTILLYTNASISLAETFSHDKWIKVFKEKDISTNLELLQLEESRLAIKEKLGQIVPSLNIGTVLDTAGSGPVGLLSGLSNLIGFLLPSRWFHWQESKMYYLSQYYSYMATRGNLILMAEEIYLVLKKTIKISESIEKEFNELSPLVRSIQFRERIGELQRGTYARIKARHLASESDLRKLKHLIQIYYIEMNKLINDPDLDKIDGIDLGKRPDLGDTLNWDYADFADNLVEVKSLNALIIASKYTKKSRAWSLLNPSGEGFGLGYFARNQIATKELEYLKNKKSKLVIELKAKFKAIGVKEEFLNKQNKTLTTALSITKNRKYQIMVDFLLTGNLDADDYVENLDNFLKFKILLESNLISKEYLQAQKERIAMIHFYEKLDDNIPERQIKKLKKYQRKEDKLINENGGI